jgi:hypothetical protein
MDQLKGTWPDDITSCDPVTLNKNVKAGLKSVSGIELDPEKPANPCGLVARTYFTDAFRMKDS